MLAVTAIIPLVGYCTGGLRLLPTKSPICIFCICHSLFSSICTLVCNSIHPQYPKQSYPRYTYQPNVRFRERQLQLDTDSTTHLRYWRTCRRLCRHQRIPDQKIKQPKILIPLCINDEQRSNFSD